MGHVNQCDGCRQGLPTNDYGHHVKDGRSWMLCTRKHYCVDDELPVVPEIPDPLEVAVLRAQYVHLVTELPLAERLDEMENFLVDMMNFTEQDPDDKLYMTMHNLITDYRKSEQGKRDLHHG